MKDPNRITNTYPLASKQEEGGSAGLRNQTTRRTFLQAAGLGAAALAAHGVAYGRKDRRQRRQTHSRFRECPKG